MHKVVLIPHYNADNLKKLYWWAWNRQMECVRYRWWNYFTDLLEKEKSSGG